MAKPLFRWTCGPCLQQGLDILAESVKRTTDALGVNNFDWAICYNGQTKESLDYIKKSIQGLPIHLLNQDWSECPIPDNCQSAVTKDGNFTHDGKRCGGTLWKVAPARMKINTHEIVMDNDIILQKKFSQIDQFLNDNKVLILEEPIRFYGRYDHLFSGGAENLNSGFMGFPPGYDFGDKIYDNWSKHGGFMNLSQADEQGLLTYTLNQESSIRIKKDQMCEILGRDSKIKPNGTEEGLHFTQANRMPKHMAWNHYKKEMGLNYEG